MLKTIKVICLAVCYAWKYRNFLWLALTEVDDLVVQVSAVISAYNKGKDGAEEGQAATQKLLALKSFAAYVALTATEKDDDALANMQAFVADDSIFNVAWRLMHGDWNIGIESSRWQSFIERIRRALPFVDVDKAGKAIAKSKADPLTEEAEIGVIDVISITVLIMVVLPKITKIIKSTRESR